MAFHSLKTKGIIFCSCQTIQNKQARVGEGVEGYEDRMIGGDGG